MKRALKVCAVSGCPTLASGTRCPEHERANDRARGTSTERGYGAGFQRAKRSPEYVNATHCSNCGQPFTDDNPKTAGHVKAIRHHGPNDVITPQCRVCNYGWRRTGL